MPSDRSAISTRTLSSLVLFLLLCGAAPSTILAQDNAPPRRESDHRFPLLGNAEAWDRLPDAEEGAGTPLPHWARTLAYALPRTTAAMLELDWQHRANSPIDPILRGMMRWTVAHANRCAYSESFALADLRRAGLGQNEIDALARGGGPRADAKQIAIDFARTLTTAADTVTDEEVAKLVDSYGEKHVVAMVLLVAHANFQDRLFLSLGIDLEPGGPLPPAPVRFAKSSAKPVVVPPRNSVADAGNKLSDAAVSIDDPEWRSIDFSGLQSQLENQRDRPGRIRVPTWDSVREWLPDRARRNDPLRIKWSLVCVGHQPELALGWSACMRSFGEEAKQDRVFEESLFWVITRTIHCFY
jgi:alkylhydroperoxidase family enzyme